MNRSCGTGLLVLALAGGCAEEGPVEPPEPIELWGPGGTATLDRDTRTPMTLVLDPDTRHLRAVLRGEAADMGEGASAMDSEADARTRMQVSYGLPWVATGARRGTR